MSRIGPHGSHPRPRPRPYPYPPYPPYPQPGPDNSIELYTSLIQPSGQKEQPHRVCDPCQQAREMCFVHTGIRSWRPCMRCEEQNLECSFGKATCQPTQQNGTGVDKLEQYDARHETIDAIAGRGLPDDDTYLGGLSSFQSSHNSVDHQQVNRPDISIAFKPRDEK